MQLTFIVEDAHNIFPALSSQIESQQPSFHPAITTPIMYSLLALAALVSTTIAGPVVPPLTLCPKGCNLIIQSSDPTINNMYLSTTTLPGSTRDSLFTATSTEPSNTWNDPALFSIEYAQPKYETLAIHAHQTWQETLGLQETMPGFLSLIDLWKPWESNPTVSSGRKTEWSVFLINSRTGALEVKDETNIPTRKWVAYKDDSGKTMFGLWDGQFYLKRSRDRLSS